MDMDFQHNPFDSQEFINYIDNISPPSTGSSSSYTTFQYPPFTSDSGVPNSLSTSCLPSIESFGTADEWPEYSPNEPFPNLPIWTSDCDSTLVNFNTHNQIHQTNNLTEKKKKPNRTSAYKHIPHREKPVHLVVRRNARERKRVEAVNHAFLKLRKVVPVENRNKRLSKVKTLQCAIEYINSLERILEEDAGKDDVTSTTTSESSPNHLGMNSASLLYR